MSLFTTLAHRIQATPGLSTVYSWGQQAGTRLQPAYQDASQRVQQVSQQTRPVVDDVRQRVSSAGTYVVERVASQPREQIQTPQPQQAAQVAIVRTQPPAVVQSIQPCHQPGQQKPPLTLTSFVVGATKGAQDAGQRFGEKHPGAAKVVHAPLERMATTIQRDKQRTALHQVHGEEKAKGIEPSVISRTAYKVGTDVSGRIRQTGWESAEYYRKEMPVTGKYLAGIATVSTEAFSKVPEFIGMVPGGVEVMAKTTYEKRSVVPEAMAVGLHRATFGTAEEFIHHPVQTSADIGAFMVVGGAVKGGVSRIPRGKSLTHDTSATLLPRKPPSKATPSKTSPSKIPPEKVYDYLLSSEGGKTIVTPLDPHAPPIYSKPLVKPSAHTMPTQMTQAPASVSIAPSGTTAPRVTPKMPAQITQAPASVSIVSSVKPKLSVEVAHAKPPSHTMPAQARLDVTLTSKGGKTILAPARTTPQRMYYGIKESTGSVAQKVGAVTVAATNIVSKFRPPKIQIVKTVKGFKSAETTTPSTTSSSVKPIHKTRIAINKDFPPGKQDISGTYDVSFTQKTSKSYVPKVKGQKYTERTEGTGQQVITKYAPDVLVEKKTGMFSKHKKEYEMVPGEITYRSRITPDKKTKIKHSKEFLVDKELFVESDLLLTTNKKQGFDIKLSTKEHRLKTVETSKTKIVVDSTATAKRTGFMGGKQSVYQRVMPRKVQLIAKQISNKIPKKTQVAPVRTTTLKEPHGTEVTGTGSKQVLLLQESKPVSAITHKGEVVSQVRDVSISVPVAPAVRVAAAASSSLAYAGAFSHGYAESDYDYSSVYPSSAFVPAVIRSQEATGFENIQATSVVPIAATWQPTNIVPVVMQQPVRQAVHEVVPIQRTRVGNVPSYVNATSHFNTQVPRTEIIPVQRENQVTRHDELYKTDTAYKTDTVLAPSFMPVGEMPPIEIPIFGKSDDGFLKKKKKKKGKVAPQKQHKVRAWYPAALESVTAEQFQTGGKLTPHIAPAKTTRDLMREFIQTGRGIPTAKQHKARGN